MEGEERTKNPLVELSIIRSTKRLRLMLIVVAIAGNSYLAGK
jgi:hypothetical protein